MTDNIQKLVDLAKEHPDLLNTAHQIPKGEHE